MGLNWVLGGEKPSIICTGDAAAAQGGPNARLWHLCPVMAVGCPPTLAGGCAVGIAACGQGEIPGESRGLGGPGQPPSLCGQETVAVAAPGDKKALWSWEVPRGDEGRAPCSRVAASSCCSPGQHSIL